MTNEHELSNRSNGCLWKMQLQGTPWTESLERTHLEAMRMKRIFSFAMKFEIDLYLNGNLEKVTSTVTHSQST